MIIKWLLDIACSVLFGAFSFLDIVKLPVELIGVLSTILQYGVWVVGSDIMAIFFASVFGWWSFKLVAGLIVFIWRLLPLT